jgi:NADH-quinone oxidoreductase subunit E
MQQSGVTKGGLMETRSAIKAGAPDVGDEPGRLLSALENAQRANEYNYLSEETLRSIAEATGEALSRVYSVATFYSYFNLNPQGKHTIVVCRGTACHTRGSLGLLKDTAAKFGMADFREDEEPSFTTEDRQFTIRTVACFGQCALAPVVAIDGTIHSRITQGKLASIIDGMRKGGRR